MRRYLFLLVTGCLVAAPAQATLVGCDYWDRHDIGELEARLDRANAAYHAIADPTSTELKLEYQRMWQYWLDQGHDPARQMGDEIWLRRVYHGRVYRETVGFVPTEEEFWIHYLDTRHGAGARHSAGVLKAFGPIAFDENGTAIDPPPAFRSLYSERKDKYFEQIFLAAMIIDALPSCNASAETEPLIEKAFDYMAARFR